MTKWTVVALRTAPDAQGRVASADFIGTWTTSGESFSLRDVLQWAASVIPAETVYIGITRSEEP